MKVLGLDLSLTSTGVALPDGTTLTWKSKDTGMVRLLWLEDRLLTLLAKGVDLVVLEGYSFASRNSRAHAAGELGGVIRLRIWKHGLPMVEVPPASLKKYALGKGGGKGTDKDAMGIAAMKRVGLDFSGLNDECDAWWLRAMALDAYGEPVVTMPAAHRTALASITWPDLDGRTAVA